MNHLIASDRAPYLLRAPDVEIPDDIILGAHVILHSGTQLGSKSRIEDGAIIGRVSPLSVGSNALPTTQQSTILGPGTIIGAYAIVCAGTNTGPNAYIGDHALLRENVEIGAHVCVGFSTSVGSRCCIGDRTRIQGFCGFAGPTIIEEDCLIGPYVVALASTFRKSEECVSRPVRIGSKSRIGSAVQLMPCIEVGSGALVDAASVVTRDVLPGSHVRGSPARLIGRS